MAFEGFGDIFTSHYTLTASTAKALELRFWTDATGSPGAEADSLRTSLDPVGLTVTGSAGTQFAFDGYGTVTLDSDITTPAYQPGGDPTPDPADIKWLELYDTSYLGTVAFAELGTAITIAGGQEIKVKSATEFRMGYPGSDDVPPAPGNLTYTEPNEALADALATELGNDAVIDGAGAYDELHVHLDTTASVDTNPKILSLTTTPFTTSVTAAEGRCSIDFVNTLEYQFNEAFSVNGITLELVDASTVASVYLAYTDRNDSENFGTQYKVNSFDIIV